jgi:ferritin-like metal-binding protein YciE
MAKNQQQHPTLAAHVAEAAGAEREIEASLAAHLLLVSRAQHHARLERHLEAAQARVSRLEERLKELGGSPRSVPRPSRPAKQVKGAAKTAEERAAKIATGSAKKVRDAKELRRVLEAARDEAQDALRQAATYTSLRALARATKDKETAGLAKSLRAEHRDWADFLADELKALSKRLVKAEAEEREQAASARRSSTAKRAARSRSGGAGSRPGSRSGASRRSAAARR